MLDEHALASACVLDNVDPQILSSLVEAVNGLYSKTKQGKLPAIEFERLLTEALSNDERIDLLTFGAYKAALGKYYSTKRYSPVSTTSFVMIVESKTPYKARIRVSDGVSLVFMALQQEGKLTKHGVRYCHAVIHTKRDVRDSDVMHKAENLARRAMNSLRKTKRKRRAA